MERVEQEGSKGSDSPVNEDTSGSGDNSDSREDGGDCCSSEAPHNEVVDKGNVDSTTGAFPDSDQGGNSPQPTHIKRGTKRRSNGLKLEQSGGNERRDHRVPNATLQHKNTLHHSSQQLKGRKGYKEELFDLDTLSSLQINKPYACHYEGCTKRFTERSKLKRHFLTHTGEKSFFCPYEGCGKAFSLDFNLRSHMKTHTGEYHGCPHDGCEKRYCQEYKLRAHMFREHGVPGGAHTKPEGGERSEGVAERAEKLRQLEVWRCRLEKWREGRRKRIRELEAEEEMESNELAKLDKALEKLQHEEQLLLNQSLPLKKAAVFFSSYDEEEPLLFSGGRSLMADHGATLVTLSTPTPQYHNAPLTGQSTLSDNETESQHHAPPFPSSIEGAAETSSHSNNNSSPREGPLRKKSQAPY